jgi:predicted Na+-dependent transporter
MKDKKWTIAVLVIGSVLAVFLPPLLVDWLNGTFGSTGQVGDNIGGIAGPILNLTGLIVHFPQKVVSQQ